MKEILLLVVYWFIAGASLIWPSAMLKPQSWVVLMWGSALLLLSVLLVFLSTKFLKDYHSRVLVVFMPVFFSSVGSFGILWLMDMMVTRFLVLAALAPVFVGVFNFVLYFEDVDGVNHRQLELIHRKYLEYARSFFWSVAIIVVAYLAWELQSHGVIGDVSVPWALPNIVELMQLVSVIGFGGMLTFLGFHIKLSEIERLTGVS